MFQINIDTCSNNVYQFFSTYSGRPLPIVWDHSALGSRHDNLALKYLPSSITVASPTVHACEWSRDNDQAPPVIAEKTIRRQIACRRE